MRKPLIINNDPTLRLLVDIQLNQMKLTIQKKVNLEVISLYSDNYEITIESEIDEIFIEFYKDYLKLNEIEDYWTENFQEATVIDFPNLEDIED